MDRGQLIYVVEDDREVASVVRAALEQYGFKCRVFYNGKDARREMQRARPDLCIIDLLLPDMDGLLLVQETWNYSDSGVFVLTGLGDTADRVLGLELGADDYITKPFEPRELVARVNSYFRRLKKIKEGVKDNGLGVAHFAGRTFNADTLTVTDEDGDASNLSSKEAVLLISLLRAPNKVLSRDQLLNLSAPDDLSPFDRSVDVSISRIRKKIGDGPEDFKIIKTIYGAGYLLACDVTWE